MKKKLQAVVMLLGAVALTTVLFHGSSALATNPTPTALYINMADGGDALNNCQASASPCKTVNGALLDNPSVGFYGLAVTTVSSGVVNVTCNTALSGTIFTSISTTCNLDAPF